MEKIPDDCKVVKHPVSGEPEKARPAAEAPVTKPPQPPAQQPAVAWQASNYIKALTYTDAKGYYNGGKPDQLVKQSFDPESFYKRPDLQWPLVFRNDFLANLNSAALPDGSATIPLEKILGNAFFTYADNADTSSALFAYGADVQGKSRTTCPTDNIILSQKVYICSPKDEQCLKSCRDSGASAVCTTDRTSFMNALVILDKSTGSQKGYWLKAYIGLKDQSSPAGGPHVPFDDIMQCVKINLAGGSQAGQAAMVETGGAEAAGPPSPVQLTVKATSTGYSPDTVALTKGVPVQLRFSANPGAPCRQLILPEYGISLTSQTGEVATGLSTFTPAYSGMFAYTCPGHPAYQFTINVVAP